MRERNRVTVKEVRLTVSIQWMGVLCCVVVCCVVLCCVVLCCVVLCCVVGV